MARLTVFVDGRQMVSATLAVQVVQLVRPTVTVPVLVAKRQTVRPHVPATVAVTDRSKVALPTASQPAQALTLYRTPLVPPPL